MTTALLIVANEITFCSRIIHRLGTNVPDGHRFVGNFLFFFIMTTTYCLLTGYGNGNWPLLAQRLVSFLLALGCSIVHIFGNEFLEWARGKGKPRGAVTPAAI